MATGHSRGAAGDWRPGRTSSIRDDEGVIEAYSVGPQNMELDGSNYRGGAGASLADIDRAVKRADKAGARFVQIATLIKRDSRARGFRWISITRSIDEMVANLEDAKSRGMGVNEFAERIQASKYTISFAPTWTIIPSA